MNVSLCIYGVTVKKSCINVESKLMDALKRPRKPKETEFTKSTHVFYAYRFTKRPRQRKGAWICMKKVLFSLLKKTDRKGGQSDQEKKADAQ